MGFEINFSLKYSLASQAKGSPGWGTSTISFNILFGGIYSGFYETA